MNSARPIFVVGYPRSGTTLLCACIGQHSQVVMAQEPDVIFGLRRLGMLPGRNVPPVLVSELAHRLSTPGLFDHLDPDTRTKARDRLRTSSVPLSFRDIYEMLLPIPNEGRVWGEKSLSNLFYARDIVSMYPDALIVHIRRDVRAVSLSRFEKRFRFGRQPIPVDRERIIYFSIQSFRWRHFVMRAERLRRSLPAYNWMDITYEAFVADSRAHLADICQRVGLSYEDRMLDAEARAKSPVVAGKYGFAHTRLAREIDPGRALSFVDLPEELLWVIERLAEPAFSRFGYSPVGRRPMGLRGMKLLAMLLANSVYLRRDLHRYLRKNFT